MGTFVPKDRPSTLAWDIERARGAGLTSATPAAAEGVNQAVAEMPENDRQEVPALHVPETDTTKNVPAITRAPSELNSRYAQLPGVNDASSPRREFTTEDIFKAIEKLVPMSQSQKEQVGELRRWLHEGRAQSASFAESVEAEAAFVPIEPQLSS